MNSSITGLSRSTTIFLVVLVASIIIGGLGLLFLADVVTVHGNELGVVYKWNSGIQDETLPSGLHVVWFGSVNCINIGTQKVTFATPDPASGQHINPPEYPGIEVTCGKEGGQKATIDMTVNYALDPKHVVMLWKDGIGKTYVDVVLRRIAVEVVNAVARPHEALDIYSGVGFNTLAKEVEEKMRVHPMLQSRGIIIENATIYDVDLSATYEAEIANKQLAKQQKLTKVEQTLAAEQEALRIRAQVQGEVEQRTGQAEAKKIEQVKAAEGQKQQQVLAAEAEKEQNRLRGEGEQLMKEAQAKGVRALGTAEAEVEKLKRDAMYEGEAGFRRAFVQIIIGQAEKLSNLLKGVNVISEKTLLSLYDGNGKLPLTITDTAISSEQTITKPTK